MNGFGQGTTVTKTVSVDDSTMSRRTLFKSFMGTSLLVGLAGFNQNSSANTLQKNEDDFWRTQKTNWDREQAFMKKMQLSSAQKLLEPLAKMMEFYSKDLLDFQTTREVLDAHRSIKKMGLLNDEDQKRIFVESQDDAVNRIHAILSTRKSEETKRKLLADYFEYVVYAQYTKAINEYKRYQNYG
jgi:hypothetical protein